MISRLEPTRQFVDRIILLNRFHAPDEEDYESAHHALGQIHQGFPDGSVSGQAAYLVASVAQSRPFAAANFRTAWDYVADLLAHRGYDLDASLSEAQELGNEVWDRVEHDSLEAFLEDWFRPRIHKL